MNWIRKTGFPLIFIAILTASNSVGWIDMNPWLILLIGVIGGTILQAIVFGLWSNDSSDEAS